MLDFYPGMMYKSASKPEPCPPFTLEMANKVTQNRALDAIDATIYRVAEAAASQLVTDDMEAAKKQLTVTADLLEKLAKMRLMVREGRPDYRNTD